MRDFDQIIEAIFALFIVFVLGYVFVLVFSAISTGLATLFVIVLIVVVAGMLYQIFRRV